MGNAINLKKGNIPEYSPEYGKFRNFLRERNLLTIFSIVVLTRFSPIMGGVGPLSLR